MIRKSDRIVEHLRGLGNAEIAAHSQRFFKTGKGEYGEGDVFLGIRVPVLRKAAVSYKHAGLPDLIELLHSRYHEVRLFSLISMVNLYARGDSGLQQRIYDTYLQNTKYINNWDLVDTSADKIVGCHLFQRDREVLAGLAGSSSLWERRIAVMATFYFIRRDQFDDTLRLAVMLLDDDEDLIHKAAGWMLREVGKRDEGLLRSFLDAHCTEMPRTMLRYGIEKLSQTERKEYLVR